MTQTSLKVKLKLVSISHKNMKGLILFSKYNKSKFKPEKCFLRNILK